MLWRPTYETRVLRDVALPRLAGRTLDGSEGAVPSDGPLLGAFGLLASAELGVWRRLIEEAFPYRPFPTVLIRDAWTPPARREIERAVPPSLHGKTVLADDPERAWTVAVAPDRPERAFGAILEGGVASLLMVGLPTEEAWDEFRERAAGA